jgi:hypothetical protein
LNKWDQKIHLINWKNKDFRKVQSQTPGRNIHTHSSKEACQIMNLMKSNSWNSMSTCWHSKSTEAVVAVAIINHSRSHNLSMKIVIKSRRAMIIRESHLEVKKKEMWSLSPHSSHTSKNNRNLNRSYKQSSMKVGRNQTTSQIK